MTKNHSISSNFHWMKLRVAQLTQSQSSLSIFLLFPHIELVLQPAKHHKHQRILYLNVSQRPWLVPSRKRHPTFIMNDISETVKWRCVSLKSEFRYVHELFYPVHSAFHSLWAVTYRQAQHSLPKQFLLVSLWHELFCAFIKAEVNPLAQDVAHQRGLQATFQQLTSF